MNEVGVRVQVGMLQRDGVAEIETWLQSQVEPAEALRWHPRGGGSASVGSTAQLAMRVAAIPAVGDWGCLDRGADGPWAQTMRVHGGFIVEVGGDGPDSWARRVHPIGSLGPDGPRTVTRGDEGYFSASHLDGEVIGSASGVAQVLWGWLHRGLPAGYELREVTNGVD